jgi:hypothetical protein
VRPFIDAPRVRLIEAELNSSSDLIDVLSARAARAPKHFHDLAFIDRNALGNGEHGFDRLSP